MGLLVLFIGLRNWLQDTSAVAVIGKTCINKIVVENKKNSQPTYPGPSVAVRNASEAALLLVVSALVRDALESKTEAPPIVSEC